MGVVFTGTGKPTSVGSESSIQESDGEEKLGNKKQMKHEFIQYASNRMGHMVMQSGNFMANRIKTALRPVRREISIGKGMRKMGTNEVLLGRTSEFIALGDQMVASESLSKQEKGNSLGGTGSISARQVYPSVVKKSLLAQVCGGKKMLRETGNYGDGSGQIISLIQTNKSISLEELKNKIKNSQEKFKKEFKEIFRKENEFECKNEESN